MNRAAILHELVEVIDEFLEQVDPVRFAESVSRWWERPATEGEKRFKMAGGDTGIDAIVGHATKDVDREWRTALEALQHKVSGWVRSEKVSPKDMLRRLADTSMDLDGFESALVEGGQEAYRYGTKQGVKELELAGAKRVSVPPDAQMDAKVSPDRPFQRGNFTALLQSRSFRARRGAEQHVFNAVADVLENAYEHGLIVDEAMKDLDSKFSELLAGGLVEPGTPGYDATRKDIQETIVRTMASSAFSAARQNLYERNSDFVLGIERDEVGDGLTDRSHPISEYADGLKIRIDDPRIRYFTGPISFNCRGVAIPITTADAPDGNVDWSSDADIDRVIEKGKELSPRFF